MLGAYQGDPYNYWYSKENKKKFFERIQGQYHIDKKFWVDIELLPFVSYALKKSILIFCPNTSSKGEWKKSGPYCFIRYNKQFPDLIPVFENYMQTEGMVKFYEDEIVYLRYLYNQHYEVYLPEKERKKVRNSYEDNQLEDANVIEERDIDELSSLFVSDNEFDKTTSRYKELLKLLDISTKPNTEPNTIN